MAIILKSIKPGRHFRIEAFKPDRAPGYVFAQEVIIERNEEGRITSFNYEVFNKDYPAVRCPVEGRMTPKTKAAALERVMHHLNTTGMIAPDQTPEGALN